MGHRAGEHVGNRLDAAVRMPGEAGTIVRRPIVAKIVEQEKGVELVRCAEAECPAQMNARAFDGRLGFDDSFDGP